MGTDIGLNIAPVVQMISMIDNGSMRRSYSFVFKVRRWYTMYNIKEEPIIDIDPATTGTMIPTALICAGVYISCHISHDLAMTSSSVIMVVAVVGVVVPSLSLEASNDNDGDSVGAESMSTSAAVVTLICSPSPIEICYSNAYFNFRA